jgi:DNA-binding response OmpR family regulator
MAGENLLIVDDSPTILKVVESALTRAGYRVDTAFDVASGLALARSRRPAVILIDSLLPGDPVGKADSKAGSLGAGASLDGSDQDQPATGGVLLCGALAGDSLLARTPVVLMIAKGEDLEARYAQTPNVIDYITKPFLPDTLVAVVSHVIQKAGAQASPGSTSSAGRPGPAPSAVTEALSRSSGPARTGAFARLRETMADRLEHYRQESGARELGAITRGALTDEVLEVILEDAGLVPGDGDSIGPDLGGRLGAISMSEVLTLLGQQGQTGVLRARTEEARVDIFFRKGSVELAAAVGVAEEFLLGRFFVEAGDITPDALTQVLDERAKMTGTPALFGRDLVTRGLITPEQLKRAMRRQTAELVYEALRWSRGSFYFKRADELPELAEEASLGIPVDTLLLEGFRRVDEWRLIERDIQTFDLVFVRAEDRIAELPRGTLTRDEIAVLDALSGKSSVRDVVRALRMGSFDVSRILYRLLRTKLIRRRIQPIAAT